MQASTAQWLLEEFKGIFERIPFAEPTKYSDIWLASAQEAAVKDVIRVAEMFERQFDLVCDARCLEQSNANAERVNGKFHEAKTICGGHRAFESFMVATFSSAEG